MCRCRLNPSHVSPSRKSHRQYARLCGMCQLKIGTLRKVLSNARRGGMAVRLAGFDRRTAPFHRRTKLRASSVCDELIPPKIVRIVESPQRPPKPDELAWRPSKLTSVSDYAI